ncbi:hypothetical protein I2486_18555, partial [Cellulophaga sp. E16_2]|nr:hypothetical protein [Cellulophaga sp. E16_2]
ISETDITVTLPAGTDVTNLSPVIIHTGASISPESEITQDFTNPVTYTVTAQDDTTQDYIVTIIVTPSLKYHRFEFLGNDLNTATTNYCESTTLGLPKLNLEIEEKLAIGSIYLVSGSTEISNGYYKVYIATDSENSDADENISGDFFTNVITLNCATEISFDPSTGIYTAPAGSTVTINASLVTEEGLSSISLSDSTTSLLILWPGWEADSNNVSGTISMPTNEIIIFTGTHNGAGSTLVTINNDQGASESFIMDVDNGMPQ